MKLYGFWRSTCTWRVRIGLYYKNLAFDYQAVNLIAGDQHADGFGQVNTMRQVPVLELDDGTRLAQSLAILEYLDEIHPSPSLLPKAPLARQRVRQLAEIVASGIQPMQNTGTQAYLRDQLKTDPKEWVRHFVDKGLSALEREVAATAGRFSVGDEVTIADACLVPQLYFARRFHLDLDRYPTLARVDAACAELPAFQRAHAEAQPDAPTRG